MARYRGHNIQIIWLQRDLVLLDKVEQGAMGRTRNIYITGHAGDALIIETTATEQKFRFMTREEVAQHFEEDDQAEDVFYERVAPTRPARRQQTTQPPQTPYTYKPTRAFAGLTVPPDALENMATVPPGAKTEQV